MKINFNQGIKTIDGGPIPRQGEGEEGNLRLIDTAINALLSLDEKSSGEDKFKRYDIAMRIHSNATDVDLKTEEIAMVKELIGKMYSPLVVGQAWRMLEGKTAEKGDDKP